MHRHADRHARDPDGDRRRTPGVHPRDAADLDSGACGNHLAAHWLPVTAAADGLAEGTKSSESNTDRVTELNRRWHPALYAGSAEYYAIGRVDYPIALAQAVAEQLGLGGAGRLLDIGCGPGKFTLLLAPWFEQAVGVDADEDMLAEAERQAARAGIGNTQWFQL